MRTVIHMTFANPIIARAVNTQTTCRKAKRERRNHRSLTLICFLYLYTLYVEGIQVKKTNQRQAPVEETRSTFCDSFFKEEKESTIGY